MKNTQQDIGISRFSLYGEAAKPSGERFVHLENLDDRSRPSNWVIKAHAHADLHHIFALASGGGVAGVDGVELRFHAPCIIAVPAGMVHAMTWIANSEGRVITFSDSVLRGLSVREPGFAALFDQGGWTAPADLQPIEQACQRLALELGWGAAGHEAAVEAHLTVVLVEALRLRQQTQMKTAQPGPYAALTARYRALLEQHFREQPSIEWSAEKLGVSASQLRAACRACAVRSPVQMLHDRLRLEAERLMRYSNMSVTQVAAYLGFSDPAYFSRFFSVKHGLPPREFMKRR